MSDNKIRIDNFEAKEWFSSRKWGMFNHFLNLEPSRWRAFGKEYKDYNERVKAFDASRYAKLANELNAGYVVFTITQLQRYMCAPNKTYNEITGLKTGEGCSDRDLIADIIDELDKYNIPLFLYFTGDGPSADKEIAEKMGYKKDDPCVTESYVKNWTSVMAEYAKRYGNKIHGWWIDGCYDKSGYSNENRLLKYYADAAKSGNPTSLIAFNNGVVQPDYNNPKYEKYYKGETNPNKRIIALWKEIQNGNQEPMEAFKNIPGNSKRYSDFEVISGEPYPVDYPGKKCVDKDDISEGDIIFCAYDQDKKITHMLMFYDYDNPAFGISDIAKYKINYGSDARFVAGYAVEKDDAIVGLSTVAPNGKIDEFAHFHGYEAVPIIVYDDSLRENKMYEGTINDVLTYDDAGENASVVIPFTFAGWAKEFMIYKNGLK